MDVFDKNFSDQTKLDESTPLTATIESTENFKDHTEYLICVQRGFYSQKSWSIKKRYSDFVNLNTIIEMFLFDTQLPPKKLFGNRDQDFIAERQIGLQNYLNSVLAVPILSNSLTLRKFLDPANYTQNFQEIALQQISMFFRSDLRWEILEPLPNIGCRIRKEYFLVRDKNQPKEKFILSWCGFGPDEFLTKKESLSVFKQLPLFQHPYLMPIAFAMCNDQCSIVIRAYHEKGSLHDQICKQKPRSGTFLKKYSRQKQYSPLNIKDIQIYGKQLLEALKYLYDKGFYYGHLHNGNILVDERLKECKILDVENGVLGLTPNSRGPFLSFRKLQDIESIDVYNFGKVIYEMAFGESLTNPTCDNLPPQCPAELRSVLESILTTEACKNRLPTFSELLSHNFFCDIFLQQSVRPNIKIPSKLKECLKIAKSKIEERLKNEQVELYQASRVSKAQAFHGSKEAKERRRKSQLKQLQSQDTVDNDHSIYNKDEIKENDSHQVQVSTPADTVSSQTPLPPPPPPVDPSKTSSDSKQSKNTINNERGALLTSINRFDKSKLSKQKTIDKSAPRI